MSLSRSDHADERIGIRSDPLPASSASIDVISLVVEGEIEHVEVLDDPLRRDRWWRSTPHRRSTPAA